MSEARALIADDHELFSWALQSLLTRDLRFDHVELVSSFQDAVDALSADPFKDLLCLDLSMPGMNGFESVRALKAVSPPNMLIVIVTASSRRDDVADAIRAGVNGYILKTMHTPEISEALRMVLHGQVFVPPMMTQQNIPSLIERRVPAAPEECGLTRPLPSNGVPIGLWSDLTPRQKAVGDLIVRGRSNKEIAIALGLAEGTVKVHVAALFRMLHVRNRTEAVSAMMTLRTNGR